MFNKPTLANNRYELISTLGQGGMACVFKALDTRLKVEKAIKIPNHQCLTNKRIRDRFENEATTMAKLHHKNIVVVHDIRDEIYEDPGGIVSIKIVYMVMEMLPGGSLQDRIDTHGPLHPQQALDAAIQMADGLGYAHHNNVVHRDVKLDNVLIGSDNTLKVTDFGIAQIDGGSGMTQTGATMGTLAFMAPEQKLSSRRATAISDLYSVGASLYLMLTNRNPSELYAHDIQEKGFADLPDEVGVVLGKCCHLEPKERYQTASELIEAFESLRPCFGEMPADSLPFYIPSDKPDMQPEDVARQERKVTNMWTTLLGIDPDELTGTIPRPKVAQPKVRAKDTALDFGTFDSLPDADTNTAIDVLGLDLTSDFEIPHASNSATETLNQVSPPPSTAAAPELVSEQMDASSSKGGLIAGALGLLVVGGWFLFQGDPEPAAAELEAVTTSAVDPEQKANVEPPAEAIVKNEKKDAEIAPSDDDNTVKSDTKGIVAKPAVDKVEKPKPKPKPKPKASTPRTTSTTETKTTPTVEKEAVPTTFGSIVVSSIPWAEVYVKNQPAKCIGKNINTTPCKLSLATGWNSVVLRTTDQNEKKLKVKIAKGNNTTQCWSFLSDSKCNR